MEYTCDSVVNKFLENLKVDFKIHHLENRCIIVTPFLYPDFASIELFLEPVGDNILLTDEGETLNMLFMNGLNIEKNKALYKEVKEIAQSHNVDVQHSAISITTNPDQLGEASQNILNAIQAIAYLVYKRRNIEQATFDDEVEKLLISNEVKYDSNYVIRGKANRHKIKFHVNSNRNLLIEPISAATIQGARSTAKLAAYKWLDIRQVNTILRFVSVIDDREQKWENLWSDEEAKNAIYTHSDEVIRWTIEQPKFIELFAK
jgi:hypothetical protein